MKNQHREKLTYIV